VKAPAMKKQRMATASPRPPSNKKKA
jgi:hypothetical protein